MKSILTFLIMVLSLFRGSDISAQEEMTLRGVISDGPYIFMQDGLLHARWIKNDVLKEVRFNEESFATANEKLKLKCNYDDLIAVYSLTQDFDQVYNSIDSLAVLTDLHGEYNTYIKLLKANKIISKELNWTFGKGHLVILGDIFDRGDKVTEILWHLFMLERQAEAAGGRVHIMLGNHELLILDNDLTYTNEKYRKTELILKTGYSDLYAHNSVLGRWLRSKPVAVTINKMLFIHGGIPIELVRKSVTVNQINKTYSIMLNGGTSAESASGYDKVIEDPENDPLWYRGYFTDKTFNWPKLDSILSFYSVERIIVGHTAFEKMISIYNNRIIGVDAGITNQNSGEMLIYRQGTFYRGLANGKRILFKM